MHAFSPFISISHSHPSQSNPMDVFNVKLFLCLRSYKPFSHLCVFLIYITVLCSLFHSGFPPPQSHLCFMSSTSITIRSSHSLLLKAGERSMVCTHHTCLALPFTRDTFMGLPAHHTEKAAVSTATHGPSGPRPESLSYFIQEHNCSL